MNLHLFMDPIGHYCSKFAARVGRIDPENNLIVNINEAQIKFEGVIEFKGYGKTFRKFLDSNKNFSRVYYHYYNPIFQEVNFILKKKNPEIISVWCFWGGDFFSLPEFLEDKYLPFSSSCIKKTIVKRSNFFRNNLTKLYHKIKGTIHYNYLSYIKSFQRIDFFAGYFYDDFEIVKNLSNANFKFHKFPYLSLDLILGNSYSDNGFYNSDSVMVGHSADPSLNHYEILEILNKREFSAEVYLPLSYGNDIYKEKLIKASKSFDLSIKIQSEMLPLDEYNLKQRSFGFAIFNVSHQQAFGNIISLLWFGVKLFLHENSSIYKEFKSLGFYIYEIANLNDESAFNPLSLEQKRINRELLNEILSSEKADEMNLQLLRLT